MKSLMVILEPLSIIWLLLGGATISLVFGHCEQRRSAWTTGAAWLLLTVFACTPLPSLLLAAREAGFPPVPLVQLPDDADAIVCLGGGAAPSLAEPVGFCFRESSDRLTMALLLLAREKAPILVVGGGGYSRAGRVYSEADHVKEGFIALGFPAARLISLGVCSDTHDEARKVAVLARERGWKKVLLVTSASHMRRSLGTFAKAGVSTIGVPCNYVSSQKHITENAWFRWPGTNGFRAWSIWLHEVGGTVVYRWRGWLD